MASDSSYLEYVLDQLHGLEGITYRPMMGEYILYIHGKVFGGVYDNRFLIKQTTVSLERLSNAPLEKPYSTGKEMILIEDIDNEYLKEIIVDMEPELPLTKKRRR